MTEDSEDGKLARCEIHDSPLELWMILFYDTAVEYVLGWLLAFSP